MSYPVSDIIDLYQILEDTLLIDAKGSVRKDGQ